MKIALSMVVAMFLISCGDEKSSTSTEVHQSESTTKVAQTVAKEVKHEKVFEEVKEKIAQKKESVLKEVKNVEQKIVQKKESVVKAVEKTVATQKKKIEAVATEINGANIFKKCVSCHGVHAEKKALGKSQVIKGWDTKKVMSALQGYKNGTYGGPMKGLMKSQVAKLSDAELKALAKYISEQ